MFRIPISIALLTITVACSASEQHHDMIKSKTQNTINHHPNHDDGVLRIVAIGDSLAYGAGDESGGGIPARIESELHARGVSSVEATNLGVNGAQTADLAARLKQERARAAVSNADSIILSIGANDLFRTQNAREATLRDPLGVATRILDRIEQIVTELHRLNPDARVFILGGYNPVPKHPLAPVIEQYLGVWDATLASRFAHDERVAVVKMSDLVTPSRLSRYDSFHPGGAAYREIAKRIAEMLVEKNAA